MLKNKIKFNWNNEYIQLNKLSVEQITEANIELLDNEVFVKHPKWNDYYISQYGRGISVKGKAIKLLSLQPGGGGYYYFKFSEVGNTNTPSIGVHRAVADVFCPDFWDDTPLEAHHIDKVHTNNYYKNLILLPRKLHSALHQIKKIVQFDGGTIKEINSILDLVYSTGLTLEEIILANKGNNKPLKSNSKYTIFDIKGYLIGYQYYPKKGKK